MNNLVIAAKTPSDAEGFPFSQKKQNEFFPSLDIPKKNKKFFLSYRPCLSSVTFLFSPPSPQVFPFFSLFIFPRRRKAFQDNPSLPLHFPPQTPGGFPGQPFSPPSLPPSDAGSFRCNFSLHLPYPHNRPLERYKPAYAVTRR